MDVLTDLNAVASILLLSLLLIDLSLCGAFRTARKIQFYAPEPEQTQATYGRVSPFFEELNLWSTIAAGPHLFDPKLISCQHFGPDASVEDIDRCGNWIAYWVILATQA
jgi:hypothetical protein